ncbi:MAG: hypothetical protein CSA18_05110, partial [Deltaproteobacteria bacterium]
MLFPLAYLVILSKLFASPSLFGYKKTTPAKIIKKGFPAMQTIQPIATVSEQNPGQIIFQCPGIPATGDFFLETFSSGLQLLVMNMNFSQ